MVSCRRLESGLGKGGESQATGSWSTRGRFFEFLGSRAVSGGRAATNTSYRSAEMACSRWSGLFAETSTRFAVHLVFLRPPPPLSYWHWPVMWYRTSKEVKLGIALSETSEKAGTALTAVKQAEEVTSTKENAGVVSAWLKYSTNS